MAQSSQPAPHRIDLPEVDSATTQNKNTYDPEITDDLRNDGFSGTPRTQPLKPDLLTMNDKALLQSTDD